MPMGRRRHFSTVLETTDKHKTMRSHIIVMCYSLGSKNASTEGTKAMHFLDVNQKGKRQREREKREREREREMEENRKG